MSQCKKCGRELLPVEMSLHRKLIDKGTTKFYCKSCLSEYIGLSEERLDMLAQHYKDTGCLLFKTDD